MNRRQFAIGLLGTAALWGCAYGPGYGPPPHAPAHGYRRKHRSGVELVYDAGLGAYVVVGYPGVYFHDGHYYRLHDGRWHVGVELDGPWRPAPPRALPPGLRKKAGPPGRRKKY